MAYSADGKVLTNHALMDEIVFAIKKIFAGIVVKNDMKADLNETQKSVNDYEIHKMIESGTISFGTFPFDEDYLSAYGFKSTQIKAYLEDRYAIPDELRDDLVEFCLNYYNETFEEKNNYYRTLMGLPEYNSDTQYWITYDGSYDKPGYGQMIPDYYKNGEHIYIDESLPLHQQTREVIDIIQNNGGIDTLLLYYRGSKYSYIRYLGGRSIDLWVARSAAKYDILYMPHVERLVEERFKELFIINREIYLKRTYQSAYIYESDYYEEVMIIMILCQTFADIITEIPEWYIRRDIFDLRSVKYFLDSYGVEYFPEIPLKYQIRIVKNLNNLIKYKSSTKNMYDIVDIFGLKNTEIYEYYLYKRRRTKGEKYIHTSNANKNFELLFIKSAVDDNYDNYIKNNLYREDYDTITLEDKYWDGELDHQTLKKRILEEDFTIQGTKYMSIQYIAPQGDYTDQMQFFVGTVLNSSFDMDDFTVTIPTISNSAELKVSDLFLLLLAFSDIYDGVERELRLPPEDLSPWELPFDDNYDRVWKILDGGLSSDTDYPDIADGNVSDAWFPMWQFIGDGGELEYTHIESLEDFNHYLKYWFDRDHTDPEFVDQLMYESRKDRVHGFNNVDLELLDRIISREHSRFGFKRGYTLADLGADGYISPKDAHIQSAEELIEYYHNNMAIYQELKLRLSGRYYKYGEKPEEIINSKDYDEYKVIEFVFNTLFTKKFDYEFFELADGTYATKYSDILFERNYVLYQVYMKMVEDQDEESRKENLRDIMNDIVNTLEYYLSGEGLEYIFSFASTSSFDALLRYIYLMINFFKSWKVQFLDPYVTYRSNDYLQNAAIVLDGIRTQIDTYESEDQYFIDDTMAMNEDYAKEDYVYENNESHKETLGVSWHFDPDPFDDYIYDGQTPYDSEEDYKIADGRFPEDRSQYPYIVLNGSNPELGEYDPVLDGGEVIDLTYPENYLVIDGGTIYNSEDERTDWYGTLGFKYIVDGGPVSYADVLTPTMRLDLHDHQIYADVRLSEKAYNVLNKDENGLYILDDWVKIDEFQEFLEEMDEDFINYTDIYETLSALVDDIVAFDIDEELETIRMKYVGAMEEVLANLEDDTAKNKVMAYTDELVDELIDTYSKFTALGTWNEFDPV